MIIMIWALLGLGLGYYLVAFTDRIIACKRREKEIAQSPEAWLFDRRAKASRVALALLNGLLWAFVAYQKTTPWALLLISLLIYSALLIAVIDLRVRLIPNQLAFAVLGLGAVFQLVCFGPLALGYAAICMVAMGVIFVVVAAFMGLGVAVGAGDVKLAAAMGLAVGYPDITVALLAMCAALLCYIGIGFALRKLNLYSMFPFAPFMMIGLIAALVLGLVR